MYIIQSGGSGFKPWLADQVLSGQKKTKHPFHPKWLLIHMEKWPVTCMNITKVYQSKHVLDLQYLENRKLTNQEHSSCRHSCLKQLYLLWHNLHVGRWESSSQTSQSLKTTPSKEWHCCFLHNYYAKQKLVNCQMRQNKFPKFLRHINLFCILFFISPPTHTAL